MCERKDFLCSYCSIISIVGAVAYYYPSWGWFELWSLVCLFVLRQVRDSVAVAIEHPWESNSTSLGHTETTCQISD